MLTDERRRGVVACLRNKLGFSLSDIARVAGVNPSTVHAWLTGTSAPQADKLERLYSAMPETVERCLPEPPSARRGCRVSLRRGLGFWAGLGGIFFKTFLEVLYVLCA